MVNKKVDEMILDNWESPLAIHPGEFLRDILNDYSMTQEELSNRMGYSKNTVNEIITGKNSITKEAAMKLSKIFGLSFEYWVNLQIQYDSDKVRLESKKRIQEEIDKYINIPEIKETYHELVSIGLLKKYSWVKKYYSEIILSLQKFFGSDSLDYVQNHEIEPIFRKYNRQRYNNYSIAAWLRIGEIKARAVEVLDFNYDTLKGLAKEIKNFSKESPDIYLPKLEKALSKCGVVLVCAPYLKNTNLQGATQWIDKNKVCIVVKTTHQSEDKFWFGLLHEIGHILLKHGKSDVFIDFLDDQKNSQEQEADSFAQDNLLPNYNKDIKNYTDYRLAIRDISAKYNIATSIVAGRIAHECRDIENVWMATSPYIRKINYTNILA